MEILLKYYRIVIYIEMEIHIIKKTHVFSGYKSLFVRLGHYYWFCKVLMEEDISSVWQKIAKTTDLHEPNIHWVTLDNK